MYIFLVFFLAPSWIGRVGRSVDRSVISRLTLRCVRRKMDAVRGENVGAAVIGQLAGLGGAWSGRLLGS